MTISEALLPEFDHEMATTRRVLERFPEDRIDWAPHPKSMKLGRLAGHIAEMTSWGTTTLTMSTFDMGEAMKSYQPFIPATREELLKYYDAGVASLRQAIAAASNDDMMASWTMTKDGQVVMSMPKVAVLRSWVFNHNVHHRGQMSVYLRMCDVPVPSIYGPSADEQA